MTATCFACEGRGWHSAEEIYFSDGAVETTRTESCTDCAGTGKSTRCPCCEAKLTSAYCPDCDELWLDMALAPVRVTDLGDGWNRGVAL